MKIEEVRVGSMVRRKLPTTEGVEESFTTPSYVVSILGHVPPSGEVILKSQGLYDMEEITPLPVNEKWLLRLGFRQNSHLFVLDLGEGLDLTYNSVSGGWFFSIHYTTTARVQSMKYVHQIQNLYQSITGKELQIQPL